MDIRNPDKFYFFHYDHMHDTNKCHTLKNKIEKLIVRGYLQRFVKRRTKLEQKIKENCIFDELPEII